MEIFLNDRKFDVADEKKVTDFLTDCGFVAERVLLEINGTIVPSGPGRAAVVLRPQDRLVALKLVAGG